MVHPIASHLFRGGGENRRPAARPQNLANFGEGRQQIREMVDRQHAQDAVKNSRVKWQGLGAGFSPGQGRRFRPRRRQHLARRVDAVPDTTKNGQGGGVIAGPTADVEIPPARRARCQTADNRRIGSAWCHNHRQFGRRARSIFSRMKDWIAVHTGPYLERRWRPRNVLREENIKRGIANLCLSFFANEKVFSKKTPVKRWLARMRNVARLGVLKSDPIRLRRFFCHGAGNGAPTRPGPFLPSMCEK